MMTRLDQHLFAQGLAPSRERARALIMAGLVYVNGNRADKPGMRVTPAALVEVRGKDHDYVSRGGLKLEKAMRTFPLSLEGKTCMDIGASTGGFTDCMLLNGAARVYAVDVGYGQLAWKLRCDERVVNMERTNIRHLTPGQIPDAIDFFSVDVSFISLKHVFPVMQVLAAHACEGVCLVKPQFEAGKEKVGKKGVVKDPATHLEVIRQADRYALASGFSCAGITHSPIKGPEGNIEFLLWVQRADNPSALPAGLAEAAVRDARIALAQPAASIAP